MESELDFRKMKAFLWLPALTLVCCQVSTALIEDHVARGAVKSCAGCRLNSLPEVKGFIFEDLPKYDGVVYDRIPGHSPELVLYNAADQEIEHIDLAPLDRAQCNKLVLDKGFKLKSGNEL